MGKSRNKIVCVNCKQPHPEVPDSERGLVIAYYLMETQQHGQGIPKPADPRFAALFRAACFYLAAHWHEAPAWACNTGHWHGPPLVDDLAHVGALARKGDRVICNGMEYEWDGKQWEARHERPMPRELTH